MSDMAVRAAGRVPLGPADMPRLAGLKLLVNQRLNAAVEEIFGHFERAIVEYEEEMERRHRRLLEELLTPGIKLPHAVSPADVQLVGKGEVWSEQRESGSSLDQEDPDPPHIKEEQEEPWTIPEGEQLGGLEEAEVSKFTLTPVRHEDDDEEPHSSQLHRSQAEDNRGAEPLSSSSTHTKAEGDDGGGGPGTLLQTENRMMDFSETDDSDDGWIKPSHSLSSGGTLITCSECGKAFSTKSSLSLHKKIHTGEKPYTCALCSKCFHVKKDLNRHMKYHNGEKPFSCNICGKDFTEKGNLKTHMRVHTGEKPYGCPFCGKSCAEKAALTKHMRVHTGEKPFSCNICGKSWAQKGNLKIHMRVHTGEKPFSCHTCDKSFSQHGALKRHMELHAAVC